MQNTVWPPSRDARSDARNTLAAALIFFLSWFGYAVFSVHPGFVHEDLAETSMWAGLGFSWGYTKHPPLLPWCVGAVGLVLPITWITLAALAAVNLTVAALAVWRIAAMTVGPDRASLAILLFCLSPYTTTQAIKLNHNSVLLSLWPLAVLAFLRLIQQPTALRGAVLGGACALAVLAKYTSILLTLGICVAALIHTRRWTIIRSPAPYVAALVFCIVLAPHVVWMRADNYTTLDHAFHTLALIGVVPWTMLRTNLIGLLPMLLATAALIAWIGPNKDRRTQETDDQADLLSAVFTVTLVSYAAIIGLTMALA
jgi:4-amino-4-deoxy-L-arabinose transferase-like glycosyltransferase